MPLNREGDGKAKVKKLLVLSFFSIHNKTLNTYPNVVIVTIVYQNAAGMLVNVVLMTFFSA